MCCDGTIFSKARAAPGEDERLVQFGLSIVSDKDKRYFALPCRHHDSGRCTIYADRFTTCKTFQCALLTAYQSGEVTLEEAQRKVQEAQRLRGAIAKEEPTAVLWAERQRLKPELALSKRAPQLLLNMIALDRYLDRWFRKRRT